MKLNFKAAEFVTSCGVPSQLTPSEKLEIAFCGRSNAGKSTLLNRLCERKNLARVSSTPGKTATINFFSLGDGCDLVDLPGYGFANRSFEEKKRWAALMEGYFNAGRNIALALVLLDCRHDPSRDDVDMFRFLRETGLPFLAVLTKTDKLKKSEAAGQLSALSLTVMQLGALGALPFSANEPADAERLRSEIIAHLDG